MYVYTRYTVHGTRYTISMIFVYTRSHLWTVCALCNCLNQEMQHALVNTFSVKNKLNNWCRTMPSSSKGSMRISWVGPPNKRTFFVQDTHTKASLQCISYCPHVTLDNHFNLSVQVTTRFDLERSKSFNSRRDFRIVL